VDVERLALTLRAVAQRSGGGDVSLRIPVIGQEFGGGVDLSRQEVQTIELSLVPPTGVPKGVGKWDIKDELVGAILGIGEGVRKAAKAEPKFELQEAAVELNLVVGKEGRLSLVGKGSAGQEAAHTVKVYLKPRAALAT
jgi:NTP-dependent ternary system trypsin peptidase co-occuring protein